jgi:hypothetical protein
LIGDAAESLLRGVGWSSSLFGGHEHVTPANREVFSISLAGSRSLAVEMQVAATYWEHRLSRVVDDN